MGTVHDASDAATASTLVRAYHYSCEMMTHLSARFHWLGRKITRLTNQTMNPQVARIIQASYKAIPFAAIRLAVPFPWFVFSAAAVIVYKTARSSPSTPPSFEDLQNGTAFGCMGLGTFQFMHGITSANPVHFICGVANVAVAGWLFSKTKLFDDRSSSSQSRSRRRARV